MANKDRQKRSARKARAIERRELEEKRAASAAVSTTATSAVKTNDAPQAKAGAKKKAPAKGKGRIATWFSDVSNEMHRVTWPSKTELKNYSIAVVGMLVVFGIAVWLIDTGVVAVLVSYSGLRG